MQSTSKSECIHSGWYVIDFWLLWLTFKFTQGWQCSEGTSWLGFKLWFPFTIFYWKSNSSRKDPSIRESGKWIILICLWTFEQNKILTGWGTYQLDFFFFLNWQFNTITCLRVLFFTRYFWKIPLKTYRTFSLASCSIKVNAMASEKLSQLEE